MSEALKRLVRNVLDAYGQGDIAPLRAIMAPDVIYFSHAPRSLFRFAGRHEGVIDVIAALSAIATDYSVHRYKVREIEGEGDIVWYASDVEVSERRTGKSAKFTLAGRWAFHEGHLVSAEEFFDSASVALATGAAATSTP